MRKIVCLLLFVCICSVAGAYVVTFENLTLGNEFHVGDTFTSGGMTATGGEYFWASGSTLAGVATVKNDGKAGGAGNEIWFNNINLNFSYAVKPLSGVSLMFGEYGGNVNLSINGDLKKAADFSALNGTTIGGATVFVTGSNASGSIFAVGPISSFGIGGQELAIDNIIACIPEPASMALVALGGLLFRKHKQV
ncbi:MAG: PEP-CTERM sorting domain-containing protein [Planctomycetes bacterium]|nr:PEP-CTERM sorting domain-containing protein [Planctomycetota bacterium]